MRRLLVWCTVLLLLLQCVGLDLRMPLAWATLGMVIASSLKLLEARRPADHRLVALLHLVVVGLLAAQMPGLLASLLQVITTVIALAGLLAQELGGMRSWRALLLRSLQLMAATLPLALVLFVFLPRIGPLWNQDLGRGGTGFTGLSPDLDPLGIAELVRRDAPAARVSFSAALPVDPYWRVLVHDRFDGRRWKRGPSGPRPKQPVVPRPGDGAMQWWTLEPARSRAVPWDGASLPASSDLEPQPDGELIFWTTSAQARSLRLRENGSPLSWQQQPPGPTDLQLPRGRQPRLEALAAEWARLPGDQERLAAAEAWFRSQPFRYSLAPGDLREGGLDGFLFDRQVGFCGHYASAFSALMRAAGVPARVVSGYLGGAPVQPISGPPYLDIRQSDAHAWSEVWLVGEGWRRVDPTRWVGGVSAEQAGFGSAAAAPVRTAWLRWLQWQWWGLDLAWTRWWLSFDQSTQAAWLEQLLGAQRRWLGLMVVAAGAIGLVLGLRLLRWQGRGDPMQQSLRLLQRHGVTAMPGESFAAVCRRAAAVHPDLAAQFLAVADAQQQLAHAALTRRERRWQQRLWQQALRQLARRVNDFWSGRAARR